ncbi:hypothetical protein HJD18_03240 [Thermoleophilia bacterium SCSIO 60948]|nr:hypothetical protein HJD18_03240 [Thermoleophilia bacterium SCSIO 60948]
MKRRITTIAVALCASLAFTAAADAATNPSQIGGVRFDQPDNRTIVIGNVGSPAKKCEARRTVVLFARDLNGDTSELGTDKTSDNGGFFFRATLPEDLDEVFVFTPPKKVSRRLRCAAANGPVSTVDTNPND